METKQHDRKAHRQQQQRMAKLHQEMQDLQQSVGTPGNVKLYGDTHGDSVEPRTLSTRQGRPASPLVEEGSYRHFRTPPLAADACKTDIMAVIEALQRSQTVLSPARSPEAEDSDEYAKSPSPAYTPPDRIDLGVGVTIVSKPVEPSNEVMRIRFGSSHEFILAYSEILRGGPSNSFLQMWNSIGFAEASWPLKFDMPNDRSPYLFCVIHAYLKGEEVIPLKPDHEHMLAQHYTSTHEAYKQLCREAGKYGIYSLMTKIRSLQKGDDRSDPPQPGPEQFRVYDSKTTYPFSAKELARLAKLNSVGSPKGTQDFTVVVIGATIKFAGRLTENRSPQLEYSIVARATPVTLSFSKLFDCLTDTVPAQFVVEGALNLEQAQRVKLDVLYKDITDGYSDDEGSASTPKKAHYTLESTLLTLHPNHGQEPPAHLINTWLCGYFPEEDNDDDDDDDDNPQSNGRKQQIPLKRRPLLSDYWLQIPYATVVLRYHLAEAVPFISSVVIESIYTATREVLAAHLPEELKPPTL